MFKMKKRTNRPAKSTPSGIVETQNKSSESNTPASVATPVNVVKDPNLDIQFYRSHYSDLSQMKDEELEVHWVTFGKSEGRFPNKHAFVHHAPEMQFVLDPTFYLSFYPDLSAANVTSYEDAKWHWWFNGKEEKRFRTAEEWVRSQDQSQLLFDPSGVHYFNVLKTNSELAVTAKDIIEMSLGRVEKPIKIFPTDIENATFYKHIGLSAHNKYNATKDEQKLNIARNAWRLSCYFKPSSEVLEILAGTFFAQNDIRTAQKVYEQAFDVDKKLSIGAVTSLLNCYEQLHRITSALRFLKRYKQYNPDQSIVLEWIDNFCQKLYFDNMGEMQVLGNLNKRDELLECAEKYVTPIYDAYFNYYNQSGCEIPLRSNLNTDRILIVGDYHIPQCIRYRIDQKVEQLESQGKTVVTVDWREIDRHQNELALHDIVIFYRVPAIPSVIKAMAQVNANGKASFFEVDDLLFDTAYPAPIETYGGYVDISTHIELRKSVANFYSAAKRCRFGIASTRLLQEKLANLVQSNVCLLHRNGLDKLNFFSNLNKTNKTTVDIFYGSGTQAHNSDFLEQALPALEVVLAENHLARLVVAGYLELPHSFKQRFKQQLVLVPPVKSVRAYWNLLEQADINLAILNDDVINGCKSELKWFEAACLGVPSIVSETANYRDVIKHGQDALMVSGVEKWTKALRDLVCKPKLRSELADNALKRIKNEYSVQTLGKKLVDNINRTLSSVQPVAVAKPKKKVAIVNVFFPPQAIGGATRVVTDNIDVLQKQYGEDFELVVFTSDNHCTSPYQLSCYQYEGIPVYRSTILYREYMDWHPKDDNMYTLFERFLETEKPDLVHFHCVQRMSASIVEATKDAEIPYIITAHDAWWISDHQFLVDQNKTVYPEGHPDIYAPRVLPPNITLSQSIERIMYFRELLAGAKTLLTVSEGFAEIYRKNGYPDIQVNKNGISALVDWKPKQTQHSDKVICAHIGGMAEHKGYFLLKDAITETQPENIEMLIVDHSKDEGYVNKTFWGGVPVTFIGRMSQSAVSTLYQHLDVLFAPSVWPESYGLVTREAVACGCWVVASSIGGIGEDVEQTNGHKIEPLLEELKDVIKNIDLNHLKYKSNSKTSSIRFVQEQVKELTSFY